jgi:predicted alpha/beta-hydrolase family hydrolase
VLLAAVVEGAGALATRTGLAHDRLVLGGRSMGGRICSMAVGDGLAALGLALVSYPLHPPGKADRLRTEHFPQLDLPCLFVSGTRDAFGTVEELEQATKAIPGPVTHRWIESGDHGLRRRDDDVAVIVRDWVLALS